MRRLLLLLFLACLAVPPAFALTIGHDDVDRLASLPQSALDQVATQRWLFAHASVGSNILDGLSTLHDADPTRFPVIAVWSGNGTTIFAPPATTTPGTIYDANRGNPGWLQKIDQFDAAVRDLGWRYPKVDVAMDKLCFIDDSAEPGPYLASMAALEQDFPDTRFIYVTRPLTTAAGPGVANIGAFEYNTAVRQHCSANNRLLFDLADIESHDPAGNAVTFTVNGVTYERLYDGYASDIGHLNTYGSVRMAMAWYAAAAAVAAHASGVPAADADAATRITAVAPNPFNPVTSVRFRLEAPGRAQLAVFDPRGRLVARLLDRDLAAGEHEATWRGSDAAGRSVPSGVYLLRLTANGATSVRRAVLAR